MSATLVKLPTVCLKYQPLDPLSPVFCSLLPGLALVNSSSALCGSAFSGSVCGPTGRGGELQKWPSIGEIVCSASFKLTACGGGGVAWLTWEDKCPGRRRRAGNCCLELFVWTSCSSEGGELTLGNWSPWFPAGSENRPRPEPLLISLPEPEHSSWERMLEFLDRRLLLTRPNVALTSWSVILAWWPLPAFVARWFTDKSSISILVLAKKSSLLSLTLESRPTEAAEVDWAAFLLGETFTSDAPFGLISADRKMESAFSLSGLDLVSVWVVLLELPGSARRSETDPAPSGSPTETWLDFASSVSTRTVFFLGLEPVGDTGGDWVETRGVEVEEDAVAALIWSDSFCFFFLVDEDEDDNDWEEDDGFPLCDCAAGVNDRGGAGDSWDTFLLFFDCLAFPPPAADSVEASWEDDVWFAAVSFRAGGVLELGAALQCGRWLFSLLYVFPQNGQTSGG